MYIYKRHGDPSCYIPASELYMSWLISLDAIVNVSETRRSACSSDIIYEV